MNLKFQLNQLKSILANVQKTLIFVPENPSYDTIAAGLGIYLGLLKQGKLATIVSNTPVLVEDSDLVGIDKIKNSLGGKNMIISFPYEEGKIDKVSYNFEGEKFNLVIEPKDEALSFSEQNVEFSYGGAQADLIFTVGVSQLPEIGKVYFDNKSMFDRLDLVNIDNKQVNARFGKINIINHQLPTLSEIAVLVLKNLNIVMDKDLATNLYKGLQKGTNNFHPETASALSFEAAAYCLRSGATKAQAGIAQKRTQFPLIQPQQAKKSQTVFQPQAQQIQLGNKSNRSVNTNQQVAQNNPIGASLLQTQQDTISSLKKDNNIPVPKPSSDWLKPKIFSNKRAKN